MHLSVLPRNPTCTLCDLSSQDIRSICIPAHLLPYSQGPYDQAVLFLSSAPSFNEDQQGRNFVGPAGDKLDSFYVHGGGIERLADLWCANAVRCRTPQDTDPSIGQLRACSGYLQADVSYLSARYRRVAIVCLGGPALRAVLGTGRSVSQQASLQAQRIDVALTPDSPLLSSCKSGNVYLFGTYNPAYLLRDPSKEASVEPVMEALAEWLATGTITYEEMPPIEVSPRCPRNFSGPVAFDTETHACLVGSPMNAFHPMKAVVVDGVPRNDLIVCSSIAWRDGDDTLHVGYFDWREQSHRTRFIEWLTRASEVWGQNLQYDLKMVRAVLGTDSIPAWRPVRDLLIETFLYDDLQERGLKVVSFLYRIASYAEDRKPHHSYNTHDDPALPVYACKDSWTTYRGIEVSRRWQAEKFGAHPIARSKLSPARDRWYSDQVWSAVLMEEHGCAVSVSALSKLHSEVSASCAKVIEEARALGVIVEGPGKMESCTNLILEAASCAITASARVYGENSPEHVRAQEVVSKLETTDKNAISTGADNRNQLAGVLPLSDEAASLYARKLALFAEAQSLSKIVNSYTGVLLHGKRLDDTYPLKWQLIAPNAKHWAWEINPRTGKPYSTGKRWKRVPDRSRPIAHYDRTHALMRIRGRKEVGIAYPSIYVIPKASDETGDGGGTKQFRWSFKQPALQTLPERVFDCICSRFVNGRLLKYDLSSIEWRMAGYRANDPVILMEIEQGVDMHARTASELLEMDITDEKELLRFVRSDRGRTTLCAAPDSATRSAARTAYETGTQESKDFLKVCYTWARNKVGKSPNFAWSYGGQVPIIIVTCRVKGGIEVSEATAQRWYDGMQSRYTVYAQYRESYMQMAQQDFAVHLPILGQSRSFLGTPEEIRRIYGEQITSPPIQTPAACIMQSAIVEVQREISSRGLRSVVCLNIHDALVVDVAPEDCSFMESLVQDRIRNNWYLRELVAFHDNRPFPLEFDGGWV